MPLSGDDLVASRRDCRLKFFREQTELAVNPRGCLFHHCEGAHELGEMRQWDPGDLEVVQRADGLHAIIGCGGDRQISQQVMLDPCGAGTRRQKRWTGRHGGTCEIRCCLLAVFAISATDVPVHAAELRILH